MTVWPNRVSHANSDPWLVSNHNKIRSMHPRVLLINFSNEQSAEQLMGIARRLMPRWRKRAGITAMRTRRRRPS